MRRWLRFAPAALLTLGWVLTMLTPPSVKPLTGELVAIVFGALAAVTGVVAGFKVPRNLVPAAIALGVGLLGMGIGVVAHAGPLQSALGAVGQHNGFLMWLSLPLWLYAGASAGTGKPLRVTLWSIALLGGVAALFAALDATHLFEVGARFSPEVSGLLESSISLGQVLLLTLGATAALAFAEKMPALRWTAIALFVLEGVALALSGARGAQLAFVAAAVLFGVWQAWPGLSTGLRRAFQVVMALIAAATAGFIAYAAVVGPTAPGMSRFEKLLTNRLTIWHSAVAHVPSRLLVGAGNDRFSAVVTWALAPGGAVPYTTTTSPHNVVLDWLLAGGLLGAVGMIAAFVLLGSAVLASPQARWIASRALAAGVVAWALSLLVSWVDPLSLAVAGLATGTLLATTRSGEDARGDLRPTAAAWAVTGLLLLVAVAVAFAGFTLLPLEQSWAAETASGQMQPGNDLARWQAWPDPAFASLALQAAQSSGNADEIRLLGADVLQRIPWSAETNILGAVSAAYLARQSPPASPPLAAFLAAGRLADPASGIWNAIQKVVSGG